MYQRVLTFILASFSLPAFVLAQKYFENNYQPLVHGDTVFKVEVCKHLKDRYSFLIDSISRKANKEKKQLCKEIFDERLEATVDGFPTTIFFGAIA